MKYRISRCPCGDSVCKAWHISDVAEVQGVHFTHRQAQEVAKLLEKLDAEDLIKYSYYVEATEKEGEGPLSFERWKSFNEGVEA